MMVDTGAAPNPYEAETWATATARVRLRELRAAAVGVPRGRAAAGTLVNLDEGGEQELTPGATWDETSSTSLLGRTVKEATSFRFLHSYLYEP